MTKLSAGYDFLGKLGNDLRDLSGLDTLIFELVQNADDASRATRMTFDVTGDALTVWNDGSFSDCGDQEAEECDGVRTASGKLVRCDFHSLRRISGQAKRERPGTTGAFGIGFTSVFQVTDYPELISTGRHWHLRYDERELERIDQCEGCEREHDSPGTTLILPWARDKDSPIRKGLKFRPVAADVESEFVATAEAVIAPAMTFLRRLRSIEVSCDGASPVAVSRSDARKPLREIVTRRGSDIARDDELLVIDGAFDRAAAELRERHPSVLGVDEREAEVSIAISIDEPHDRLPLHAVLPTRESTALGLRLSSSFYPFQDRKRLKFGAAGDPESDWNRVAVQSAAETLAEALDTLTTELDPTRFWSLIGSLHHVAANIDDAPDPVFADFWDTLVRRLPTNKVVWTADERWVAPTEPVFLIDHAWRPALDALHDLGIVVVHPLIHDAVAAVATEIGIRFLAPADLDAAIRRAGMTSAMPEIELPGCLGSEGGLDRLLAVVGDMIGRLDYDGSPIQVFDGSAIVPCLEGVVAPPDEVSLESEVTVELFRALPGIGFVDEERVRRIDDRLTRLLWDLAAWEVVDGLAASNERGELAGLIAGDRANHMLRWLADHADQLTPAHVETLRALPLFPSVRLPVRVPLTGLELPGPFDSDPLEITDTVDLREIDDLRDFLGDGCLGAQRLDLDVYVHDRLVPAFAGATSFADAQLDALLGVLSDKLDDLDDDALSALADLPLIPTRGAGRLPAADAYLDGEVVRSVLGEDLIVNLPERRLRRLKPLLESLGVDAVPRARDVVGAVQAIVGEPKAEHGVARIRTVVEFLGPRFRFGADAERELKRADLATNFGELLDLAWLPASKGGWEAPRRLHRTTWRLAIESNGNFLELPDRPVQQPNADLLELLGVELRPKPELVIEHLLASAASGVAVRKRVYEALDGASRDELVPLRECKSVLVSTDPVVYAQPSDVVRNPGRLRGHVYALPPDLGSYHELTAALDIAEVPSADTSLTVLRRIADSVEGVASSTDVAAVQQCWRILDQSLETESLEGDRGLAGLEARIESELWKMPCWPDRSGVLSAPSKLCVDDLPALRRHFDDAVIRLLVDRPRTGLRALRAAGLRFLSEVIDEALVAVPNARANNELEKRLRTRYDALARVVSHADLPPERLDDLLGFDFVLVNSITLHRSITDPPIDLGEQTVTAFLDRDGRRLFANETWREAPTELAVAITHLLCADEFSPGTASNIEKVLSAPNASAAHTAFDLLQIARLGDDVDAGDGPATEEHNVFGDDDDETLDEDDFIHTGTTDHGDHTSDDAEIDHEDEIHADDTADAPDRAADESESWDDAEAEDSEADADESAEPTTGQADADGEPQGGTGVGSRTDPAGGRGPDGDRAGGPGASRDGAGARSGGVGGSRLIGASAEGGRHSSSATPSDIPWRIWVSGGRGAQQDRIEERGPRDLDRTVELAGIERVLQYESDHNRLAQPTPRNTEGYDVESCAGPNKPVLRRIEVKALGGTWEAEWGTAGRPPQMTGPQFRMSRDDGRHWLYVVENACDDDAWCIYPIQTVGQKANRFLIDHGWKEAAERPAGPGFIRQTRPEPIAPPLPDPSAALFGPDDRDAGDVPFLTWPELSRIGITNSEETATRWFTSPTAAENGDFAVQQPDAAMSPTLPRGAIGVFRPTADGLDPDGEIVIADVAPECEPVEYLIRRAHVVRDGDGAFERLLLNVEVPGRGDEYEFDDPDAEARVVAVLVDHQEI